MNHVKNIEDKLSGLVSNGLTVWEYLKNDAMQRQFDIKNSF